MKLIAVLRNLLGVTVVPAIILSTVCASSWLRSALVLHTLALVNEDEGAFSVPKKNTCVNKNGRQNIICSCCVKWTKDHV